MFSIISDTKHAVRTYHNSRFGIKYYSFQSLQNAITSLGLKVNRKKQTVISVLSFIWQVTILTMVGQELTTTDYTEHLGSRGAMLLVPPSLPASVLCEHRLTLL